MKLSQENEKLKAELKAMSDRLEAAERKREELARSGRGKGADFS
jgi:phage host-nuclease inhibitor protein Gam